jgi:hypothetical protein
MTKKESGKWNSKTGISMIALLVFITVLVTSINACGFFNSTSWKEEVLLHDGSKIVIKRSYHLGGKRTLDSKEKRNLDETVTFTLPGANKEIKWKTDFIDSKPEPNSLNLLALDIVNGTPYIATYAVGCIAYNKWERPNPPYIFFKYDGNGWMQIPLEEFPAEISKVNVIVGRPPAKLQKSFYTVTQVNEQNSNLREEYKTIIRTPLKLGSLSVSCEELIYDGKYWRGIKSSFFKKQPSYEACLDVCNKERFKTEYCPCNKLFKITTKEN